MRTIAMFGWIGVVLIATAGLAHYSTVPGSKGNVPRAWPRELPFDRSREGATAVLMLHPHCPCSLATMSELERLVAELERQPRGLVLFFVPDGESDDWTAGPPLWDRADRLPGFEPAVDRSGEYSRELGGLTSGHLVVFDRAGQVSFSGGITPSRGHEGSSPARQAALEALRGATHPANADVFGCPIQTENSRG